MITLPTHAEKGGKSMSTRIALGKNGFCSCKRSFTLHKMRRYMSLNCKCCHLAGIRRLSWDKEGLGKSFGKTFPNQTCLT